MLTINPKDRKMLEKSDIPPNKMAAKPIAKLTVKVLLKNSNKFKNFLTI